MVSIQIFWWTVPILQLLFIPEIHLFASQISEKLIKESYGSFSPKYTYPKSFAFNLKYIIKFVLTMKLILIMF